MAKLSLDDRLNQIEDKISEKIKDLEMKSDIIYSIMIQGKSCM